VADGTERLAEGAGFPGPVAGRDARPSGEIAVALRMTLATLVLTGLVYPLAMTGIAQALFPWRANGSLVERDGKVVGSELIAQAFKNPAYFQPRPSAAGTDGYDATSSSGSNLGPTSQKLKERVDADVARLRSENPQAPGTVPGELVTTSGSGLDPHLSPEAARWQAPRVAAARGVPLADVEAAIAARIEGRTFGFLGEARVNVLRLNLDMDARFGRPAALAGS
jgi:K+-transporting ATPase ATPase C chain